MESITHLLGLDFAGNEVLSINELEQNRAKEKALYMISKLLILCHKWLKNQIYFLKNFGFSKELTVFNFQVI
jgi:hypothetical protein